MGMFDEFDKKVDLSAIENQKNEALANSGNYEEVPVGHYIGRIEKMELGSTKDGRPMFRLMMRLVDGATESTQKFVNKFKKKPCIFMNKVIYGTKNDGAMIASVERFLNAMQLEEPVKFAGYNDFNDVILDCAEIAQNLEFEVEYDPNEFDSIKITDVFDI